MSLQLFTGANVSKKLQSGELIAVENAQISVKDSLGVLVLLFQDKSGSTPQVNPFNANDTGQFYFFVAPGVYELEVKKGGIGNTIKIEVGISGQVNSVNIETDALIIDESSHGNLYNISDFTGNVTVTVESVPPLSVGNIVFVFRNTESPVEFIAGAGVSFKTPYSLEMFDQFSTVAMMWLTENDVVLYGDWMPI